MEERTASIRGVRSGCCCCGRQPNAAEPARARQERKKTLWGGKSEVRMSERDTNFEFRTFYFFPPTLATIL